MRRPFGLGPLARVVQQLARPRRTKQLSALLFEGACCGVETRNTNSELVDHVRSLTPVEAPTQANVLVVTGRVNAKLADVLSSTYAAMPEPKWVIAAGSCAATGGVFAGGYPYGRGVGDIVPVDLFVPGCPPEPEAIDHAMHALQQQLQTPAPKGVTQ